MPLMACGFKSLWTHHGSLAQLGEQLLCKEKVAGSSPAGSTIAMVAQLVERKPEELGVGGSNPPLGTILRDHRQEA